MRQGPNIEAMKSATGIAVRNWPSTSWQLLGFSMTAIFMASCYQADLRFTSEQTGIVRRIERILYRLEPEADANLRAGEDLAVLKNEMVKSMKEEG